MNSETIRCVIRKKQVPLTPEEEVRQRILRYMVGQLAYPAGLIAVERVVSFNSMSKRADIIIHDRAGSPWMIVECKRPSESLGERTLAQIAMYAQDLQAPYMMVSNGKESHILKIDRVENLIQRMTEMPSYP